MREILIHLNVAVGGSDTRTPEQIRDAVLGALEVGADHESMTGLTITVPLAEEV